MSFLTEHPHSWLTYLLSLPLLLVLTTQTHGQLELTDPSVMTLRNAGSFARWSPSITQDGLEMHYVVQDNGWKTHWASRDDVSHVWYGEGPLEVLADGHRHGKATFTPDGLTMIFASERESQQGDWDLWFSTRETRSSPWQAPAIHPGFDTEMSEGAPEMSSDGLTLYFAEGWPNSGTIWHSTRASFSGMVRTRSRARVRKHAGRESSCGVERWFEYCLCFKSKWRQRSVVAGVAYVGG